MFTCTLYQFSKRENSTKRPSGSGLSFSNVQLKSGCSIINPFMEFNIGTTNPEQYNYAYISNFNRYYFIEDWRWDNGIWIAQMKCDVLATYKSEIASFNGYVLRSASNYDGNIIDSLYPTKAISTYSNVSITSPWISDLTNGCYILGITSRTANIGSLSYYIIEPSVMYEIITELLSDTWLENIAQFDTSDASMSLQKAIADPLSFIKSAMFIPLSYSDTDIVSKCSLVHPVFYDWQLSTSTAVRKLNTSAVPYIEKTLSITLPKHPQASTKGNYLNTNPYTDYQLSIPPFNAFSISADNLINVSSIDVTIRIDLIEGKGQLEVFNGSNLINRVESQVFVPIQLSQVYYDVMNSAQQIVGGAGSMLSGGLGLLTGGNFGGSGILGGAVGVFNGIMNANKPISSTIGSSGSFIDLVYDSKLYARFQTQVDEDLINQGRPLMQMVTLGNLSGYMIVQDGDISLDSTQAESQEVKRYLESGFYYE